MRILRFVWRFLNNLRRVFQILLMLFILGLIFAGLSETEFKIPASAVLVVAPTGFLVDQLEGNPLERAVAEAQGAGIQQTLLTDVTDSLRAAADDDRIKAVALDLGLLCCSRLSQQAPASLLLKLAHAPALRSSFGSIGPSCPP